MSNKQARSRANKHLGKLERLNIDQLGVVYKILHLNKPGKHTLSLARVWQQIRGCVKQSITPLDTLNRFADKMDEFFYEPPGDPTPKYPDATTWFMSLPERRQDELQQDPETWAAEAFEAGREVEDE